MIVKFPRKKEAEKIMNENPAFDIFKASEIN